MTGPYYPGRRFTGPTDPSREVQLPYDIGTEIIDDIVKRTPILFDVQTLDLRTAQTTPLEILTQGWSCVIFGHDGTQTRAINTAAIVNAQFNRWEPTMYDKAVSTLLGTTVPFGFPMKHARGFYGPFNKIYLTWAAQAATWCDLIIYKSCFRPYIDGETPT